MTDDSLLYVVRRDLSGGQNTRQDEQVIAENQATLLQNCELNVAGQRSIRAGSTLIEDMGSAVGTGLFGFEPEGGTNVLIANNGASLQWYAGSGSFSTIASLASIGFDVRMNMVRALESDIGDVAIFQNGSDNAIRLDPVTPAYQDLGNTAGTGTDSPPLSRTMTYYRDRLWILKDQKLYYSGAVPSDYSVAFDTVNDYYNIPIGNERALAGTRDYGLLIAGSLAIYQLNPTLIPAPATDKPELVLDTGCAAGDTFHQVGDDFFYLAYDGVRALRRTVQDKLQTGQSQPISWWLKDEFDEINWAYIDTANAVFFDNKYILTLPTGSSTTNNKLWIYYPALNSWCVATGLNIGRLAKVKFSNEERLYGQDSTSGKVYRLFYGTDDNGTAITYQEEGRAEDFGQPLVYKCGGEFKIKVRGSGATISATADIDGEGYQNLTGTSLVLPSGGFDFPFDFPVSFGESEQTNVWHLDNLGHFKRIKFKLYCATKNAQVTILESIATTFAEEYMSED